MTVSVIVSNFNGARWLPRLLETLKAQEGVTLEIIVVNRNSTDDSALILAKHPDVKVVEEPPESGLVAGYAAGVPHARYDLFFFCNEDMWFDRDCIANLEKEISLEKRVACADPWQFSYDGSKIIHSAPQVHKGWHRGEVNPFYSHLQNRNTPSGCVVACACAGAMMIHRIAYDDVGRWDVSFFLDYEDTDLAIRLWQRGWLTTIVPEAKVYHAVGASNSQIILREKISVGKKRYIFGSSNRIIVGWKTFSLAACGLPLLPWIETITRNTIKFRARLIGWDLLALITTLKRLPEVRRFRKSNRVLNRKHPGELYYKEELFQFGAVARPSRLDS